MIDKSSETIFIVKPKIKPPASDKKSKQKLFIGKKWNQFQLNGYFFLKIYASQWLMVWLVLVHAEISSTHLRKPVKPHSLELAGDSWAALSVLRREKQRNNNNGRGLYMTSLLLKGHSEWMWACETTSRVCEWCSKLSLWWLWLMVPQEIHFATYRKLRQRSRVSTAIDGFQMIASSTFEVRWKLSLALSFLVHWSFFLRAFSFSGSDADHDEQNNELPFHENGTRIVSLSDFLRCWKWTRMEIKEVCWMNKKKIDRKWPQLCSARKQMQIMFISSISHRMRRTM